MAFVKVPLPYEIKVYETSKAASVLDKILQHPLMRFLLNSLLSLLLLVPGILIYNANNHQNNVLTILLIGGGLLLFVTGGAVLGPALRKLRLTERIACQAGKRQAKLPGILLDLLGRSGWPKVYRHSSDKEFTELTIGVTPGEAPHEFLLFSQVRPIEQKTGNPVIHARGSEAVITQALTERRGEIADAISKEFMAALNSAKKSAK